jgi:hypothetical protein
LVFSETEGGIQLTDDSRRRAGPVASKVNDTGGDPGWRGR